MSRQNNETNNAAAIATILVIGAFATLFPLLDLEPLTLFLLSTICLSFLTLLIKPKWGLLLVLILRPVLDFSSTLTILEVGPAALNLASLLGIVMVASTIPLALNNKNHLEQNSLLKAWMIFLFILLTGFLLSFNKASGLNEFIRVLTIFSLFLLGLLTIKEKKDFNQLIKVIIISMLIPSLVAIYQLLTNTGLTLSYQDVPNRLFGTFAHPNLFAFSLTLSIALSLSMLLKSKEFLLKIIYGSFFMLYFGLLALTYTRGAWILFVFMILSAGILKLRKILILSIFLFLSFYILLSPVRDRVNSITTLSPYSSITWRFNLWSDAIGYAKDAPLLGHGTGTSEELIKIRRGSNLGSTAPHNDFLKVILENGVIGLVSFFSIFILLSRFIFSEFKKVRDHPTKVFVPLIFFCFTIGLYAASFGDNILEATVLQWTFWSFAGAFLAISKK